VAKHEPSLYKTLARIVFLTAGVVVLLWFMRQIETVLLASVLSLILAVALSAPVGWLEARGMARGVAIAISALAVLAIAGVAGWLVVPRLAAEIPTMIEQVPELVNNLSQQIAAVTGNNPEIQRQLSRIVDWSFGIVEGLWRYTDRVFALLLLGIFTIALVLYMVTNMRTMLRWYIRSMPEHLREPATRAFARGSQTVIGWIIASVFLGGIKAVAAFIFLMLMGVPGAIVWAAIAFLGAFVPRVGFYIMTIPPVLVALSVDALTALWTLLFYTAFAEFLGNFVAPRIFSQTMHINAVFILFMTLAMGYAFGVIGVLIATPIAGFVKTYYDEFYLARQPDDPDLNRRVEAMMQRHVAE